MENALNNFYHTHAVVYDTSDINKNPSEFFYF